MDELNDRQRKYLQALYECDQEEERYRSARASRGFYDRTPASEWRWIMYGPTLPHSSLYSQLRKAKLVDQGTGSTWQALEKRGLVKCREQLDPYGIALLLVQITPKGRKYIRQVTGIERTKPAPKGQLRERQWAALVRLYIAGEEGELSDEMMLGEKSFDWMRTLLRLRDYKPYPLMEQFSNNNKYRMRISAFGREYYQREWARYRELYPNIEAPEPSAHII